MHSIILLKPNGVRSFWFGEVRRKKDVRQGCLVEFGIAERMKRNNNSEVVSLGRKSAASEPE